MPYFPIESPPGVVRLGTILQSAGRFYDADLVRWKDGVLQPIGGWEARDVDALDGVARAIRVWSDNAGGAQCAVGTHTKLYALDRTLASYDITPSGYTPGIADSDLVGGYGNGKYGVGAYGTPRGFSLNPSDVTVWSLDTFGEDLVCCTADDGVIYEWTLDTGTPADPVANAPTARALVVTAERILMALGADGNPRGVAWSNQEDNTDWTPTTTNYAGDTILQTSGKLMCGRKVRGGTLLLTNVDVHLATFVGQPFVYGFDQKGGAGTGIIAQGAIATMDGDAVPAQAVWMGQQGFFIYNGYVQPLDSPVAALVFSSINRNQISKATAFHNADWGEVTWFYPSGSSIENDAYVTWNYRENWWTIGHSGIRTCGTEKGPFRRPIAVDADGAAYEHELGLQYGGSTPYAETGPFVIGEGDKTVICRELIPDEKTLGDVQVTVFARLQPMGEEWTEGPFTMLERTDVRFTAREIRVRYTGVRLATWAVGHFKFEGDLSSER